MSVKVIATDMDGTFLNSKGSYDRNRFRRILKQLQERDIRFVVASSNPYRQLREHFPDCHEQLTFVGENGANIISKNQSLVEVFQQREDLLVSFTLLKRGILKLLLSYREKKRVI